MHLRPLDILFALTLLSRVCDLLSTWLVSPRLLLESNPIVRRFRWPFGFLTLGAAFLAYVQPEMTVMLAVGSFLVAGNNCTKIAASRALGEQKLYENAITLAGSVPYWDGLVSRLAPVPCYLLLAGLIYFLCPSAQDWGNYIGTGVVIYSFVFTVYGTASYNRYRKLAKAAVLAVGEPTAT